MSRNSLEKSLATALPLGYKFILHHVSTPPTHCSPIVAAAPGQKPEETHCETHFFSVSIDSDGSVLQVFAVEVLIYTTKQLTTLFVSKADSTGYLHLLRLPTGTPSPLRSLATAFIEFLIKEHSRSDRRIVLSLFARSQNQYLFPASVENSQKHILDDRGLIKWWCRVIDGVIAARISQQQLTNGNQSQTYDPKKGEQPKAYLRVPGYDVHETKAFFPRDATGRVNVNGSWTVEDPLRELAESSDVPERCLIPRFPDDPKGRFVDSLDEEIPEERPTDSQAESQDTTKLAHSGKWRSIGSLDQFWEAMSFRQECSSGRLVGFLWAVFIPNRWSHDDTKVETAPETTAPGSPNGEPSASIPTQPLSQVLSESSIPPPNDEPNFDGLAQRSEVTGNYYWPKTSRGEAVLQQQEYDEVFKFLLDLDYGNKEKAKASTSKWMGEIAHRADLLTWGRVISGERPIAPNLPQAATGEQVTNLLSAGLVRKKKRIADDDVLMAVTKKPKTQ